MCLEDQVPRDSHVERNSRRFELQRGSKYLSIEGPAGVVDDEGSVGSLTHGGPLVLDVGERAVSREAMSRCTQPHVGLPALRD